jgi:hypothetical protein
MCQVVNHLANRRAYRLAYRPPSLQTSFVFAVPEDVNPSTRPKSLLETISESNEAPFLGDRLRLAFTLLFLLHASI